MKKIRKKTYYQLGFLLIESIRKEIAIDVHVNNIPINIARQKAIIKYGEGFEKLKKNN
jgi:hypothetical protein